MRLKVIAFGDDGRVYVGEDFSLSDAVSGMSECVIATGTMDEKLRLNSELAALRAVASAMPEDYFTS